MKKLPHSERRELETLRQLLVGPEIFKLDQLSKRLENREEFSSDVGNVLPQALVKSARQGEQLSQAMVPTVEEIVRLSVKKDIGKFADALFPVIGPAIRKSIAETIREMLQSMNQVVENSLSLQGLKWRLESIRTGIPFSQIVMLNSLVFEVEQVFLIHQTTGLLLNHVQRGNSDLNDPDLVSSMLTAIGDFVSDSFESNRGDQLNSIEVGELSIWIERSPTVVLALAIRGNAPASLLTTMRETLEQVEALYSDLLLNFNGDVSAFDSMDGVLVDCLQAQYRATNQKISAKFWLACLALAALMFYWVGTSLYQSKLQDDYLEILQSEPGYAITRIENSNGVMIVNGLRDPLSRSPDEMLNLSQLDAELVRHRFRPYQSLEKPIAFKRIKAMLSPPKNVVLSLEQDELNISGYSSKAWAESIDHPSILATGITVNNSLKHDIDLTSLQIPDTVVVALDIDNGHMQLTGMATREWKDMARERAPKIQGILSYDDSKLVEIVDPTIFEAPDSVQLEVGAGYIKVSGKASFQWVNELKEKIAQYPQITDIDLNNLRVTEALNLQLDIVALEAIRIFFDAATSFNFEANPDLDRAAELSIRIISNARTLNKTARIFVRGFSDSVGTFEDNKFLSRERADYVSQYLFNRGVSSMFVVVQGIDAEVTPESSEEERRYNRRVEFEVEVD